MRYEGQLLTEIESRALIAEVDRWCRRTGTNYNKLVTAARVPPSIRSSVKNRHKRVTKDVAGRIRLMMHTYRFGITKDDLKRHIIVASSRARALSEEQIESLRVDREPCPRCGARKDVGCAHVSVNPLRARG